jgi:hypothetical protein
MVDLGDINPDVPVTLTVPAGALGFNVVVRGDVGAFVGIESLVSPSGVTSVAQFDAVGNTKRMGLGGRGIGAFSVPQTNATATAPLETGVWQLTVGGLVVDPSAPVNKDKGAPTQGTPVTTPLHVTVAFQMTDDGAFHGGELDLHVYVPDDLSIEDPGPGHTIRAADAPNDPALQRRIDVFYSELERLFGVRRGNVSFHAIDAAYRVADNGQAQADLMSQAVAVQGQALHVVLTNELQHQLLVGITLGEPGAANIPTTRLSAISVGFYPKAVADDDGVTILHEMGHFVGLAHTTDYDLTPDLLDDTPACTNPKLVDCPDADNLMWPDVVLGPVRVSPSQVRVMRGSSIYRAFPH